MTDRERLIELLHNAIKEEIKSSNFQSANIADDLTVCTKKDFCKRIYEHEKEIYFENHGSLEGWSD